MKKLPDEKELFELLEMAKNLEQQTRETSEIAMKIALKWQNRLKDRRLAKL